MKAVNHPLCSLAAPRCAPAARRDAGPRAEEGAPALRCAALLSAGFAGPGCGWSQPANLRQPLAPRVALRGRPHLSGSPGAPGRRRSVLRELWGHPGPRRKPPPPLTRVADTRLMSPLEDKKLGTSTWKAGPRGTNSSFASCVCEVGVHSLPEALHVVAQLPPLLTPYPAEGKEE